MKKKYITPETELQFILTQDIMVFSFEFDAIVGDKDNDPCETDLENWDIQK